PYYTSNLVMMVKSGGPFAQASSLADFSGAKITAQLGTFHYNMIDQIESVNKQTAMKDFSSMRVALQSGAIDGYVAERPEGVTAEKANPDFKMIEFGEGKGFVTNSDDTTVAVGLRKNDPNLPVINSFLTGFTPQDQKELMDEMIAAQPEAKIQGAWYDQIISIVRDNGKQFLNGTGMTLFISLIGTIIGTVLGLLIGVYRTIPEISNKFLAFLHKVFGWLISAYIEIFRGTPMIVQAMVLYYGTALAFGLSLDRTLAALIIVSINTGAYMS
ncbi:TPA: ABC transporter permease subunit, partial [Streptococcus pyogenes]